MQVVRYLEMYRQERPLRGADQLLNHDITANVTFLYPFVTAKLTARWASSSSSSRKDEVDIRDGVILQLGREATSGNN